VLPPPVNLLIENAPVAVGINSKTFVVPIFPYSRVKSAFSKYG